MVNMKTSLFFSCYALAYAVGTMAQDDSKVGGKLFSPLVCGFPHCACGFMWSEFLTAHSTTSTMWQTLVPSFRFSVFLLRDSHFFFMVIFFFLGSRFKHTWNIVLISLLVVGGVSVVIALLFFLRRLFRGPNSVSCNSCWL